MMEASSPHNKHGGGADRLSDLPEELIHAVMSFLPAWQAVQTSVLSRKWRDLWITMPYLDLDQHQFDARATRPTTTRLFRGFATKLLQLNAAPTLDRFRLVAYLHPSSVYGWISNAVQRCPAAIEIRYVYRIAERLDLPGMDYSRYFVRLRSLRLHKVQLDAHFAATIESGCPVLEDLELCSCLTEFSEITLPVVKNLTVCTCVVSNSDRLVVTAPALRYFACKDNAVLLHETAAYLVKASVSFSAILSVHVHIGRKLLGSLFNVTSLHLTGFETAMLVEPPGGFPVFHNMKALSLEGCFPDFSGWSDKFTALGSFVQNAPNLKKLYLSRCPFSRWEQGLGKMGTVSTQNEELRPFKCDKLAYVEIKGWMHGDPETPDLLEALRRTLGKYFFIRLTSINN